MHIDKHSTIHFAILFFSFILNIPDLNHLKYPNEHTGKMKLQSFKMSTSRILTRVYSAAEKYATDLKYRKNCN